MRWIRNFAVALILMWFIGGCLKQPENSIIPSIQLQSINFKYGNAAGGDVYLVTFEHGQVEWTMGPMSDDGKAKSRGFRVL